MCVGGYGHISQFLESSVSNMHFEGGIEQPSHFQSLIGCSISTVGKDEHDGRYGTNGSIYSFDAPYLVMKSSDYRSKMFLGILKGRNVNDLATKKRTLFSFAVHRLKAAYQIRL